MPIETFVDYNWSNETNSTQFSTVTETPSDVRTRGCRHGYIRRCSRSPKIRPRLLLGVGGKIVQTLVISHSHVQSLSGATSIVNVPRAVIASHTIKIPPAPDPLLTNDVKTVDIERAYAIVQRLQAICGIPATFKGIATRRKGVSGNYRF